MALTFKEALQDVGPAERRTLYVSRQLLNADELVTWAKSQGFAMTVPAEEMHATIAFSRAPLKWPAPRNDAVVSDPGGREVKPLGDKGAVVLRFRSRVLTDDWKGFKRQGASWDWDGFQPHVTITYQGADLDLSKVKPFEGPLVFGPERFAEVDEDWKDKITEKTAMSATPAEILDYLNENAPDIAKLYAAEKNLTLGDVHATTALGNEDEKKKLSVLEAARAAIGKGEQPLQFQADLKISKLDAEQQMVFGWASICQVDGKAIVDKQDDVIEPEEIEKAAYEFVLYSRQQGDMHMRKGVGRVVESVVFTAQKAEAGLVALEPDTGKQIFGWWVGFKVDDPKLWEAHKRGERPEFSIGGKAKREPVHA